MFSALTFNMQNGQVWDEKDPDGSEVNFAKAIEFVRQQDADIVFLQEVERGYEGGKQIEPPPHFTRLRAALPDYDAVFAYPVPNPLEIPFGLGLAILSKTPLTGFRRVDLPAADISFEYAGVRRKPSQRLLIEATTKIEGRSVRLLNTHLQAFFMIKGSSNDQPLQRNLVEAELLRSNGQPTLLGGDFNSAPEETLVQQYERAGYCSCQTTEITWRRMPFVLDHIFYNATLRLESCAVVPTLASDHHAVRSEFSFA
jgi:endonuclease/exonuclease/phosphatase family metal-dependent hydrolase